MKFSCPDCGQHFEIESMYGGQVVQCPQCGANIPTSERRTASPPSPPAIIQTLQSSIDRGSMTISQYMAQKQIEGVIDLQSSEDKSTASSVLTAEQGRKYKLGDVVAAGGMGAILDAKDANIRRHVAMKVMLEPEKAGREQILRFIQEAQVTGQLEHPGIVPLYELGVDASGNVFYTMKFVRGRTLKDILKGIKDGDNKTIEDYPLSHLLTIFQKVCDAVAFAHSKRVIHRDLKPENVMIGDYGEVQVMDWGLAKVLPRKKRKTFARDEGGRTKPEQGPKQEFQVSGVPVRRSLGEGGSPQPSAAIDSVRSDEIGEVLKTMDGSIMGTPGFMSPEQALGKTEEIDTRTDIYALGAILYNILTLEVPIKAKNLTELIDKVTTGEIRKPTEFGEKAQRHKGTSAFAKATADKKAQSAEGNVSLSHLPDNRVPESLSAVTMRALAVEAHHRYQTVKELQKEIEAYQGGFATRAEGAGAWKQMKLFVQRNKAITVTALTLGLVLAASLTAYTRININARKKAEASEGRAVENEERTREAITELKSVAPDLMTLARQYMDQQQPAKALQRVEYAIALTPERAQYWQLKADILQALLKLDKAIQAYEEVLRLNPGNKQVMLNLELCREHVRKRDKTGEYPPASIVDLYKSLREQGRYSDAIALIQRFSKDGTTLEAYYKTVWEKLGTKVTKIEKLEVDKRGIITMLDLSRSGLEDLTLLKGLPLTSLNISGTLVSDLSPLKGMPLVSLAIMDCHSLTDLTPLKGLALQSLFIHNMGVTDLTPLKGMPLSELDILATKINDLTPLRGMPLKNLAASETLISDLTPLKDMPLLNIQLGRTRISDITPLRRLQLSSLGIPNTKISDLTPIKDMVSLMGLDISGTPVTDLSPLKGLALVRLSMAGCRGIRDLTPLHGMPIDNLNIAGTSVSDLTPLKGMRFTWRLYFTPRNITNGMDVIRNLKIPRISVLEEQDAPSISSDEFWKRYDTGEFR